MFRGTVFCFVFAFCFVPFLSGPVLAEDAKNTVVPATQPPWGSDVQPASAAPESDQTNVEAAPPSPAEVKAGIAIADAIGGALSAERRSRRAETGGN